MAIFGAVNIFYSMYGLIPMNWRKTLISTVPYLVLMYSATIFDAKAEELRRFDRDRPRERWS